MKKPLWVIKSERDLERYEHRKIAIENLQQRLKHLESCTTLKAAALDKIPTKNGGTPFEDAMLNNITEKEMHRTTLSEAKDLVTRVDRALEGLSSKEKQVLEYFYISGQRNAVERLKEELGLTERQIYSLRDYALALFTFRMYGKTGA